LSIRAAAATLFELAPTGYLQRRGRAAFNRSRLRIDGQAQALTALVRHGPTRGVIETLEAETLTPTLLCRAVGRETSRAAAGSVGRQNLVDRAKLMLSFDLGRRWTRRLRRFDDSLEFVELSHNRQQVTKDPDSGAVNAG
jgi:hypothetical protein